MENEVSEYSVRVYLSTKIFYTTFAKGKNREVALRELDNYIHECMENNRLVCIRNRDYERFVNPRHIVMID